LQYMPVVIILWSLEYVVSMQCFLPIFFLIGYKFLPIFLCCASNVGSSFLANKSMGRARAVPGILEALCQI
jgi:hypothetical protein